MWLFKLSWLIILFLYVPAHEGLLFEKTMFELDYHWASLSLDFYIVLKSLVSYQGRWYLFLKKWWYWQQNLLFRLLNLLIYIKVKGSDWRPFIWILDSYIDVCNFNHVNKFVSISEHMPSRDDKINSKGIIERFLFGLFDSQTLLQIVERVCTVKLFYF